MDIRTILVDDEALSLNRLHDLIKSVGGIEVVGMSSQPEEALKLIIEHNPDVLFLDVEMPLMSGFDLLKKVREKGLNPHVIFTTAYDHYAIKAIRAEALDYLLKPVDVDELKEAIVRIQSQKKPSSEIPLNITNILTERENEILELLALGKTSKEIAEALYISKHTVDTHRRNIIEKTKTQSIQELLVFNK
jgi:DNA-binding NarL/FixJ family response regulator